MCSCISSTTSATSSLQSRILPRTMWRTTAAAAVSVVRRVRHGHGHGVAVSGLVHSQPKHTLIPKPSAFPLTPRSLASVAEAVEPICTSSSTDADEFSSSPDVVPIQLARIRAVPRPAYGAGSGRQFVLRRRQMRVETEAWEQAAREYKDLLADMCERKLAPNLPYVKSLFLGWFEPLRDEIAKEQERCRDPRFKASHGPYFDRLPADMMAVITMHKVMSLLMTGPGGDGSIRVVQAACEIGEAIEQEVKIQKFLEKTRKKTQKAEGNEDEEGNTVTKEQEFLRKKVTNLMKQQKVHQVRKIVKGQDDSKPWGQDAQAKVGSRLIELLMETAYIQPPVDQRAEGPPDIRPAFRHSLKTVTKEQQKLSRRYGVIVYDSLVYQGFERTGQPLQTSRFSTC